MEPRRVELREDAGRTNPETRASQQTSERNAAKLGPQQNPKTTRKNPI
jgi:hypothetical protein